jgi:hypothetical protein
MEADVLPMDTHGRRILATERQQSLRSRPPLRRPARSLRRRVAGALVAAGTRLAPDAVPRPRPSR